MKRLVPALVVLFAIAVRAWDLGAVAPPFWDEPLHVATAHGYVERGLVFPDDWYHPPMKHLVMRGAIAVFGEGPWGYRGAKVILGVASILLVVALCRRLLPDPAPAWIAGALLAADPLHVALSRSSAEEVQASFFLLAAIYAAVRVLQGAWPWVVAAGASLGLALATKWYFVPAAAVIVVALFGHAFATRALDRRRAAVLAAGLVLLPATAYLLAYAPWFGAGHDLGEFVRMQLDCAAGMRGVKADIVSPVFAPSRSAVDWFQRPLAMGIRLESGDGWSRSVLFMNAFPAVLAFLPAAAYASVRAWRRRDAALAVVAAVFVLTFLQFLTLRRPVYLYSAMSCIPLGYVLVAVLLAPALERLSHRRGLAVAALVGTPLAVGAYFLPVIAGFRAPDAVYGWLLSWARVVPHF